MRLDLYACGMQLSKILLKKGFYSVFFWYESYFYPGVAPLSVCGVDVSSRKVMFSSMIFAVGQGVQSIVLILYLLLPNYYEKFRSLESSEKMSGKYIRNFLVRNGFDVVIEVQQCVNMFDRVKSAKALQIVLQMFVSIKFVPRKLFLSL